MKIESNGPTTAQLASARTERLESTAAGRTAQGGRSAGGDRVNLSADGALAARAMKAASEASDVREDVVERAKARLASGELGRDLDALADSLIDRLLEG